MLFINSIAILSLAQLCLALPNPPAPFQVTDLVTSEPSGRPGTVGVYAVTFSVSDPSDGSSATCSTNWPFAAAHTGYPSSYLANCTEPSYAFKFVDYNYYYDFKLDVRHSVKKHGPKRKIFARGAVVNNGNIHCVHAASGFSRCGQITDFPLPVYDVRRD